MDHGVFLQPARHLTLRQTTLIAVVNVNRLEPSTTARLPAVQSPRSQCRGVNADRRQPSRRIARTGSDGKRAI
jgi:hypothetical protein